MPGLRIDNADLGTDVHKLVITVREEERGYHRRLERAVATQVEAAANSIDVVQMAKLLPRFW